MAENDLLQLVCLEPLLFTFRAPRTIAATLSEYEHHLREERALSPRRARETLRTLEEFLDPIEAPLVTLTPALAQTLMQQESARVELLVRGGSPGRCLTLPRVQRLFRWAAQKGYVTRNPFEQTADLLPPPTPTSWVA